jgi:hypothetical protein
MLRITFRNPMLRQLILGGLVGLALGLILNGWVRLPMSTLHAALTTDASLTELAEQLRQERYRVTLQCPVKNNRVIHYVQAPEAGAARRSLQWVMPACTLTAIAPAASADLGANWYRGDFFCDAKSYRSVRNIEAIDLAAAKARAQAGAPRCQIESVDQVECAYIDPMCARKHESFAGDADLGRLRLLR